MAARKASSRRHRVALCHWKLAEQAERMRLLRSAGFTVSAMPEDGDAACRAIREKPPDAVVIDLGRLPSHGRQAGLYLRQRPATRLVPLVFVGGAAEKVGRVREALPDATYCDGWADAPAAVEEAIATAPTDASKVIVPKSESGSGKQPLPKKLGIRSDSRVLLLSAPSGFDETLGELPPGVTVGRHARGEADLILLFAKTRRELGSRVSALEKRLRPKGQLWLAWPKGTSGVETDLSRGVVHELGQAAGLVDTKICAIDDTWSAARFARRRST